MSEFLLQHAFKFEIDVTPTATTPTYAMLAAGITDAEFDNNEEVDQTAYYDGGGASESDVIGVQKTISFEGHRKYGDEAQDFIFSLANATGNGRRTRVQVTFPDGQKEVAEVTVTNIKEPSGGANSKGEIEFELHYNGQATVTPATVTPAL